MDLFSRFPISKLFREQLKISRKGSGQSITLLLFMLVSMWPMAVEAQVNNVKKYFTTIPTERTAVNEPGIAYINNEAPIYWTESPDGTYGVELLGTKAQQDALVSSGTLTQSYEKIGLLINDGPFQNVNPSTGFTISIDVFYNNSIQYGRLIDTSVYIDKDGNIHTTSISNNSSDENYTPRRHFFALIGGAEADHNHLATEFLINENAYINGRWMNRGNTSWEDYDQLGYVQSMAKDYNNDFTVNDNKWHNLMLNIRAEGTRYLYLDGKLVYSCAKNAAVETIMSEIHNFQRVGLGNNPNGTENFKGWIRNVQIVPSGEFARLKLSSQINNGNLIAKSLPVKTSGILVPMLEYIELSEEPAEGYHLDWGSVKYKGLTESEWTNINTTTHTFQMPDHDLELTGEFKPNSYTINYVLNDVATYSATVPSSSKGHFEAFTVSDVYLEKTKDNRIYELIGWSKTEGSQTADYSIGATYAVGTALNTNLNGDRHGEAISLHPVWREKTYTVSVDPAMYGGTVTLQNTTHTATSTTSITAYYGDEITVTPTPDETLDYHTIKRVTKRQGDATAVALNPLLPNGGEYHFTVGNNNVVVNAVFNGLWTIYLSNEPYAGENDNVAEIFVGGEKLTTTKDNTNLIIGRTLSVVIKPTDLNKRLKKFHYTVYDNNTTSSGSIDNGAANISYDVVRGEYLIKITENTGELAVTAEFEEKAELSTAPADTDKPSVVIAPADQDQTWTGSPISPAYTPKKGTSGTPAENEFTFAFEDDNLSEAGAINAGSAKAVITAKNSEKYKGSIEQADVFTIKGDLAYADVVIADVYYTGERITRNKLSVTATLSGNGKTLTSSSGDLEVDETSYPTAPDPKDVGDYTVTIKPSTAGSTKFKNQKSSVSFTILPADLENRLKSGYTFSGGSTSAQNVSNTATSLTLPTVNNLKLIGAENDMLTTDYKLAYVQPDGAQLQGNTVPANTFGRFYVAIVARGSNTTGYVLTDYYTTFRKSETIAQYDWTTYYNHLYNLSKPTGYTVYQVMTVETDKVTVSEVSYIPKNVPVLLYKSGSGNSGTTSITLDEVAAGTYNLNAASEFKGTATNLSLTGTGAPVGDVYILNNNQFVRAKSGEIPANRCYLLLNAPANSRLRISTGGDDNATGIMDALRDLQEGQWYDLNGRHLEGPQGKGVYIVNGRKVIIK